MKWNPETATLEISWVDLEHIAHGLDPDELEFEMGLYIGPDAPHWDDIKTIIVHADDKVKIGCTLCQGKNLATVRVVHGENEKGRCVEHFCESCYAKMKGKPVGDGKSCRFENGAGICTKLSSATINEKCIRYGKKCICQEENDE